MKADSDLVRRQNRGLLLTTLRRSGSLARIELGRLTGLSPATVTAITADLIGEGIVREADVALAAVVRRGRPLVRLSLDPQAAHVMAVRIAVDEVEFALAGYAGEFRFRRQISLPTFTAVPHEFVNRVAAEARAFLTDSGVPFESVAHCGVAVQGLADSARGAIAWSPAFQARDIELLAPLHAALGVPCSISNDANMTAEAMLASDPGRYGGTAAFIFLGYGVGMGLVIDGRVFHGTSGAASEFGHMNHRPEGPMCRCGRNGCVEAYAADYGLLRSASGSAPQDEPPHTAVPEADMLALEQRALAGEPQALAAFALSGEALGYGIARVMALVSPERIVFTGPGARFYPLLLPALQRSLERGVVDVLRKDLVLELVPVARDAVVQGTAASALRRLDLEVFASGPVAAFRPPLRAAG